MAISRDKAKTLLTQAEYKLFLEAAPKMVTKFSERQLLSKVKVARRYRDKVNTLIRKARKEAKRTTDASASMKRSKQKLELMARTLKAFEAAFQKLQQKRLLEEKRQAKKARREEKIAQAKKKKKRTTQKPGTGQPGARAIRKSRRFDLAGNKRILGHVRAAGARKQAKRDSK